MLNYLNAYCSKISILNEFNSLKGDPSTIANFFIFIHNMLIPLEENNTKILDELSSYFYQFSEETKERILLEIKPVFSNKKLLLRNQSKEFHILIMENCEHYEFFNFSLQMASEREGKFYFPTYPFDAINSSHLINGMCINQFNQNAEIKRIFYDDINNQSKQYSKILFSVLLKADSKIDKINSFLRIFPLNNIHLYHLKSNFKETISSQYIDHYFKNNIKTKSIQSFIIENIIPNSKLSKPGALLIQNFLNIKFDHFENMNFLFSKLLGEIFGIVEWKKYFDIANQKRLIFNLNDNGIIFVKYFYKNEWFKKNNVSINFFELKLREYIKMFNKNFLLKNNNYLLSFFQMKYPV